MNKELSSFDAFVDDILSSNDNLLKGELDLLLMQYLFNSNELDSLKIFEELDNRSEFEIAA